ncbi:hypothetical protein QQP08_021586 [Theobroma cacao]|uniref:Uncharacterized protein n=1 Tax=Theobroma cacao TaxID=3641 RepID=A0A061F950_THECC|nr:Uncharacterized protein TCM_031997 [Theobroma cacao]WRX29099.1 hypothetical protein QQP08_021586 [Theobroma cacao]
MALFSKTIILIIAIVLLCHVPCFQARKALSKENMDGPVLEQSMIVSANPKVLIPPSIPAKSGHGTAVYEINITKHIALSGESVPSPGAGN